ncbi:hypothetical protein HpMMM46_04200 [Helicobacter pylori]
MKPTMGQCLDEKLTRFERQNVLCVLRTHARSLCQKWVFFTKTKRNQKKKKDFHGINKILRIL